MFIICKIRTPLLYFKHKQHRIKTEHLTNLVCFAHGKHLCRRDFPLQASVCLHPPSGRVVWSSGKGGASMPTICSLLTHSASRCPYSNKLPSTTPRAPIEQTCRMCRVGIGFWGFFEDVDKKWQTALSISHLFLRMRSSIISLKDMTDPDGFLGFFGDIDKKFHPILSISQILLRMRSSVMSLKGSEGFLGFLANIRQKSISHFQISAGFVLPPTFIYQNSAWCIVCTMCTNTNSFFPDLPIFLSTIRKCNECNECNDKNSLFPKIARCMDSYHLFYQKNLQQPWGLC
jgi:hypothetical protein